VSPPRGGRSEHREVLARRQARAEIDAVRRAPCRNREDQRQPFAVEPHELHWGLPSCAGDELSNKACRAMPDAL
jgi:hypothetical protein